MAKEDSDDFLHAKEQVMDNLDTVLTRISQCEDQGMLDPGSSLYNEVLMIMDDVEIVHTFEELEEAIIKGKEIEHNVDAWLALHGGNTLELDWPKSKS